MNTKNPPDLKQNAAIARHHVLAMGGVELNIVTAEEIMGWTMDGDDWLDASGQPARKVANWLPSVDPGHAEELAQALARQGLANAFANALTSLLGLSPPITSPDDLFALISASPRNRCKAAALAALGLVE